MTPPFLVPNLLRSLVQTGKFRPSVLVIDTSHGPECGEELQKFKIPTMNRDVLWGVLERPENLLPAS